MAEKRRSGRSKGVPHHPLVEALASDPSKPPEKATKLFGYPGPAAEGDATRLWLDTDLTTYVDVPDEAIVHSQTLDYDQGTLLWVEPSARLTYSTTRSQDVQAEFLGGSIAEGNLGGTALRSNWTFMRDWGRWPPSVGPGCLKPDTASPRFCFTWVDCETPIVHCPGDSFLPCLPTADLPCRTEALICP